MFIDFLIREIAMEKSRGRMSEGKGIDGIQIWKGSRRDISFKDLVILFTVNTVENYLKIFAYNVE